MKFILISIILCATSCKNKIEYKHEIEKIINSFVQENIDKKTAESQIESLGFKKVKINLTRPSFSYHDLDSTLEIIIEFGDLYGSDATYQLYDFSAHPRQIGNEKIVNASYRRTQIDPRWYIEEIGFD